MNTQPLPLDHAQNLEERYVMPTFARNNVEFVQGSGMELTDSTGKTYLDFLAGIAVCSLGHNHPILTKVLQEQAEKLLHVSNYFYVEHRAEVAELINKLANECTNTTEPADKSVSEETAVWKTFFANSGAEANECAMKLARLRQKRAGKNANTIVCLRGSFHGRTLETVAATMQDRLQNDFQPLPGGFLPCTPNDEAELERIFAEHSEEICAVMLEPIQGESGVHPMTKSFMQAVRRLTRENDALMICDEVQTGVFRCGTPFAFQLFDVVPDIFTMAKGIAGGVPMGACAARAEIADIYRPGDHGTTFGGSPLACAAAHAVLTELDEGGYREKIKEVGARLSSALSALDQVVEVRGEGLMIGCDLADNMPDAHDVVAAMLEEGFVLNATGPRTLRLLPPLICEKSHADAFVKALGHVLEETSRS